MLIYFYCHFLICKCFRHGVKHEVRGAMLFYKVLFKFPFPFCYDTTDITAGQFNQYTKLLVWWIVNKS